MVTRAHPDTDLPSKARSTDAMLAIFPSSASHTRVVIVLPLGAVAFCSIAAESTAVGAG
jgi:hypothetical protein